MKRIAICLILVLLFVGAANAQTKSMTGTVIDYSQGNKGNWEGITVKVGNKTYFVYINSVDFPAAKTVGVINKVGRVVQVFYTKDISSSGDYAGDVIATKIVEIKKSKSKKK